MRGRKRVGSILLVVILAVGGYLFWNSDNQRDKRVWNEFRAELQPDQVTKIEVQRLEQPALSFTGEEQETVLRMIRDAQFAESNRIGHGPTSSGSVRVYFKTGRDEVIRIYSGSAGISPRFELSPRHLDAETQFYVESEEFAEFLDGKLPKLAGDLNERDTSKN